MSDDARQLRDDVRRIAWLLEQIDPSDDTARTMATGASIGREMLEAEYRESAPCRTCDGDGGWWERDAFGEIQVRQCPDCRGEGRAPGEPGRLDSITLLCVEVPTDSITAQVRPRGVLVNVDSEAAWPAVMLDAPRVRQLGAFCDRWLELYGGEDE